MKSRLAGSSYLVFSIPGLMRTSTIYYTGSSPLSDPGNAQGSLTGR